MTLKNKSMEIRVKSEKEFDHLTDSDSLDEDELVQLYYALEISKNNLLDLKTDLKNKSLEQNVIIIFFK